MDAKRTLAVVTTAALTLMAAACGGSSGAKPSSPHSGEPAPLPNPLPSTTRTWTWETPRELCPPPGFGGENNWVPLTMRTTESQNAQLGADLGECAGQPYAATYVVNQGDTAWKVRGQATLEHFYARDEPALLAPARDWGYAQRSIGPSESATIDAEPGSVILDVDVPLSVAVAEGLRLVHKYGKSDLTSEALARWRGSAVKGTPNRMLATCVTSVYAAAEQEWASGRDIDSVLSDVKSAAKVTGPASTCGSATLDYDEVWREEHGLPPREAPLLRGMFELGEKRAATLERAAGWVEDALRVFRR